MCSPSRVFGENVHLKVFGVVACWIAIVDFCDEDINILTRHVGSIFRGSSI